MKPIKLYFAGAWAGSCKQEEVDLGIQNKLVSYLYPQQLESWLTVSGNQPGNIMVDSGAFSAWSKGKVIDLEEYVAYAHEAIRQGESQNKNVYIVNLDVIPGKPGSSAGLNKNRKNENKELVEKAAKQGYRNLVKMLKKGIKPIHVFHQGEDWYWLNKMVERTDYIGISPANDLSVKDRKSWIWSVFNYMHRRNIDVDTHGFAVWMPSILREFPWTSCDAITWRVVAGWGGIYYPQGGGFTNPDYSKPPRIMHVSWKKNAQGIGILTSGILKQLERDGYTYEMLQNWETRARINVRYFLGLEQWINEQKRKTEFKPKQGLLDEQLEGVCK